MADQCACAVHQRALLLHANGLNDVAAQELIARLEQQPDDGRTWELLGVVLFASNEPQRAQSALEVAAVLVPLSPRGQVVLGKCYEMSGFLESAAAIYRHVASLSNLDTQLLEPLASGLGACRELELALHICRQAAERMPDNPDPLVGIVHYMRRLGRPVENILPVMFRAHQLEPDCGEYRIALAWLLHEIGKSGEAASLLAGVSFDDFSCIHCLIRMQHIFEITGRPADAANCRQRLETLAAERQLDRGASPDWL